MFSSQTSICFIICLDSVCCDGGKTVENPLAEATPDFAYKPCKGFQAAVIEESQKEEVAGLALCTFPVPCNYVCSRGPRTPILAGADAGQPRSVGHSLADLETKFVVPQVVGILPAPRNEMP
jgi:hypothetical protein